MKKFIKILVLTLFIVGIAIAGLSFFPKKETSTLDIPPHLAQEHLRTHPRNRHDADIPSALDTIPPDANTIIIPSWTRARLPQVKSFVAPLGTRTGAFSYNAQAFAAPNPERGGLHLGADFNGLGGENTDLGDPVYAMADGIVIYRGCPSPHWGNVIILAHKLPSGQIIQTLYAHIENPKIIYDQFVPQNTPIAQVGNAKGLYWAHLHTAAISSSTGEMTSSGYAPALLNKVDPQKIMTLEQNGLPEIWNSDILTALQRFEWEQDSNTIQFQIHPQRQNSSPSLKTPQ